jgi:Uma2 family endonuclease
MAILLRNPPDKLIESIPSPDRSKDQHTLLLHRHAELVSFAKSRAIGSSLWNAKGQAVPPFGELSGHESIYFDYTCDNQPMSTKVLMDVSEYLRTSFEGPDCEYLDGEIVERNVGEIPHSVVQGTIYRLLWQLRSRLGLLALTEIRVQISPTRYRVADIAVWRDDNIGTGIPTIAPFLVVEILSPEDRMVRMLPKIQDYLSIGVEWIWIVDPQEQSALLYSLQNPAGAVCDVLRTENPSIEIPLSAAFDLNA